jgi:hypothetical protein
MALIDEAFREEEQKIQQLKDSSFSGMNRRLQTNANLNLIRKSSLTYRAKPEFEFIDWRHLALKELLSSSYLESALLTGCILIWNMQTRFLEPMPQICLHSICLQW